MTRARADHTAARPLRGRGVRWLAAVVVALVASAGAVLGAAAPASAFDEGTIHSLVNQSRASNGLGALRLNASMSQVALAWANQMAANGEMTHNPGYSSQIPGGWSKAAENVASGYSSGAAVHAGWMSSAGHKANILGDYTDMGIAHISSGGTTWSVEVFAKYGASVPAPVPPPAPKPAPAPAARPAPEPTRQASPSGAPTTSAVPTPAASTPASEAHRGEGAERPSEARDGANDPAALTTKLALGTALVIAFIAMLAGWLRVSRRR